MFDLQLVKEVEVVYIPFRVIGNFSGCISSPSYPRGCVSSIPVRQ